VTLLPDPVELASDRLARVMAKGKRNTVAHLSALIDGLPEAMRYRGSIRLISEHMATVYDRQGFVEIFKYGGLNPYMTEQAASEMLAGLAPCKGMRLPIFYYRFRDKGRVEPSYRLTRRIAVGGFGSIWATKDGNGDILAIKTPWTGAEQTHDWQTRVRLLAREAAILPDIRHANIVRHSETVADPGGVVYLVTEFIGGGNLASQPRPVGLDQALRWTIQIAQAADYLRTWEVVHRDITLANVGLDEYGNAKLLDFGLALTFQNRSDHEGERAGTPGSLPPEQLFGVSSEVGGRTDVAAIGILLFELVTGKPPLEDRSLEAAAVGWMSLQRQAESETVPLALRPILRRCFGYHPEDRYPTPGHLAQALLDASNFQPLQAWWAGKSAAKATVFINNLVAATAKIRQPDPDHLDPNVMLTAMMAGVGVIEEYDRLLRLLPEVAVSQQQSAEPLPLDPRRRIRSPVKPTDFSAVEDGLNKLCAATEQRIATAQKVAAASRSPACYLFELARFVHAPPAKPDRLRLSDLTEAVGFPLDLATSLRAAMDDPKCSMQRATAAYDAHAEASLGNSQSGMSKRYLKTEKDP
jgi:hypothetical protein